MSDYTVIRSVSRTLRDLLMRFVTNSGEPGISGIPIRLRSPREILGAPAPEQAVSLWMYQLVRNADRLNDPPQRVPPNLRRRPPFPADLNYLVTPLTDPENDHALLGRVVQVFNDFSKLAGGELNDVIQNDGLELKLTFQPLTLEALTRIWDALNEPYRLSVAYTVQVVRIDSLRPDERESIVHHASGGVGQAEPTR
ncbi:MAG: DUF4255 domain-containing protein [Deltaproteobacteria bacterium]